MKKLLNLIGAIVAMSASVSAVAACNNTSSKTKNDPYVVVNPTESKIDNDAQSVVLNKIKGKSISIVDSATSASTTDPTIITELQTALQNAAKLTDTQAKSLQFAETTLRHGTKTTVTVTIKDNPKFGNVTITADLISKSDKIKSQITQTSLTIPAGTDPNLKDAKTIAALNDTLVKANPGVKADTQYFSYSAKTKLQIGVESQAVTLNINVSKLDQTSVSLKISLPDTAEIIISRIKTDTKINLGSGVNPSTTNPDTIQQLKEALKTENPNLTSYDLSFISFEKATLTHVYQEVAVTATVDSKSSSIKIQVEIDNNASDIINKFKDGSIVIPNSANLQTSNPTTVSLMKTALQKTYPKLTTADLSTLTFENTTLQKNQNVNVKVTSTISTVKKGQLKASQASTIIQVKVFGDASTILQKIKVKDFTLASDTYPLTNYTTTKTLIFNKLKTANPTLTNNDLATLNLQDVTLRPGIKMAVNLYSTVSESDFASMTLDFTLDNAFDNILQALSDVHVSVNADVDDSLASHTTQDAISKAIQIANPELSDKVINFFNYDSSKSLSTGNNTPLVLKIVNPDKPSQTKSIDIMVYKSKNTADDVKTKIYRTNLDIIGNYSTDVTNTETHSALISALQKANPDLSASDVSKIKFTGTLKTDNVAAITANITSGKDTASFTLQVSFLTNLSNILNKITKTDLGFITINDLKLFNHDTQKNIIDVLFEKNTTLSSFDRQFISVIPLKNTGFILNKPGFASKVNIQVNFGGMTATKEAQLTVADANGIAAQITKTDLGPMILPNTDVTDATDQTILRDKIASLNPDLNVDAIKYISFSSAAALKPGEAATIDMVITINGQTDTQKVTLNLQSATEVSTEINKALKSTLIVDRTYDKYNSYSPGVDKNPLYDRLFSVIKASVPYLDTDFNANSTAVITSFDAHDLHTTPPVDTGNGHVNVLIKDAAHPAGGPGYFWADPFKINVRPKLASLTPLQKYLSGHLMKLYSPSLSSTDLSRTVAANLARDPGLSPAQKDGLAPDMSQAFSFSYGVTSNFDLQTFDKSQKMEVPMYLFNPSNVAEKLQAMPLSLKIFMGDQQYKYIDTSDPNTRQAIANALQAEYQFKHPYYDRSMFDNLDFVNTYLSVGKTNTLSAYIRDDGDMIAVINLSITLITH